MENQIEPKSKQVKRHWVKTALIFLYIAITIAALVADLIIHPQINAYKIAWVFIMGVVLLSLFLYALNIDKRFLKHLCKIGPPLFLFIQLFLFFYPASSLWFSKLPELQKIITIVCWVVFIFPAYYISIKYAYFKDMYRKPGWAFVIFVLLISAVSVFARTFSYLRYPIQLKTNYIAQYNELSKPEDYDPKDNAQPLYEQAFSQMVPMPEDIQDISRWWPGNMTKDELEKVNTWLSDNQSAIDIFIRAAEKPYYWVEHETKGMLIGISLPDLKGVKTLSNYLCAKTLFDAYQGQFDNAFKEAVGLYKIGLRHGGPKLLIEQLVGVAIRALSIQAATKVLYYRHLDIDGNLLSQYQYQFENLASQSPAFDYQSEKLMALDCIQRLFTDEKNGTGHVYGTRKGEDPNYPLKMLIGDLGDFNDTDLNALSHIQRKRTTELAHEIYDFMQAISGRPIAQVQSQYGDIDTYIKNKIGDDLLLNLLMPANQKVLALSNQLQTETNALITLFAILRYQKDHSDWPANLDNLVSNGYLDVLPLDHFSNKPLCYRTTNDTFILYSYGGDFDDDGGTPGKWGRKEDDRVFWPLDQ